MSAAAELRKQVESALAGRIPSALSFRPAIQPELLSCGIPELDSALGGGLPLGGITELTGTHSSGRTTLVLSTLASITSAGECCAYVDASDSLDPVSAAALGVNLRRLLWIRTSDPRSSKLPHPYTKESLNPTRPIGLRTSTERLPLTPPLRGVTGGPCHPRDEAIGLHYAVGKLFQSSHESTEPFTPRCSASVRRAPVRPVTFTPVRGGSPTQPPPFGLSGADLHPDPANRRKNWTRLDNALRATDLLLSTGGFRAIVLDMGDISPEQARRVPLATWYRFRLQVEKSRTLFLLMTRVPCANSCAAVSLRCRQGEIHFQRAALHAPELLTGLDYRVTIERSRAADPTRKKPAASVDTVWSSRTSWSR